MTILTKAKKHKICTDCIIELTDACPRGSGRAIDDEICGSFIPSDNANDNTVDEMSNVVLRDF